MIKIEPMQSKPELKEIDPKYLKDGLMSMDALTADGWTYQDFNQMLTKYWRYILKGFGEENVTWIKLTEADYGDGFMRGQLMLSPQARVNLEEYRKNNPIPE